MQNEVISSYQNPRIKRLMQLQQKSSARRNEGVFVVEGQRELMHCINAGLDVECVFFCHSIICESESLEVKRSNADVDAFALLEKVGNKIEVTSELYNKIAYRGGTEGVIAIIKSCRQDLGAIMSGGKENPLLVVLESVEKPGNLGAILRSADAAGADAVIVCDPLTDIYNPNLIRSSVGAIFSVPCITCTTPECIDFLKANKIQILTAQLQDSELYYDTKMIVPTAIVFGTEATGLTQQWREAADAHIRIPMLGRVDSLNVSVSVAILLYEAVRQRNTIS